jgi:hypothetical protein
MGPPIKDDISREKMILMTSLRTHRASAVSSPGLCYTFLPLPPCAIERSCLAENYFRGKIVHIETILFCFVGIHFFIYTNIHRKELCCEASGGAGRGGSCHILNLIYIFL